MTAPLLAAIEQALQAVPRNLVCPFFGHARDNDHHESCYQPNYAAMARAVAEVVEGEISKSEKRGDRREKEMAEQRDLVYTKLDTAEARVKELGADRDTWHDHFQSAIRSLDSERERVRVLTEAARRLRQEVLL